MSSPDWQIKPANVVTKEEQKTIDEFAFKYRSKVLKNSTFAQLTNLSPTVSCHILYRKGMFGGLSPGVIVYVRPSNAGNHIIAADAKELIPLQNKLKEILATPGHFMVIPRNEFTLYSLITGLNPVPNEIKSINGKYNDLAKEHGQGDTSPFIYGILQGTRGGGKRRSLRKSKTRSKSKAGGKSKSRTRSRSKSRTRRK